MNYDKIGEFIASKRKEKSMTQSELAKKLGVTDKAVSKWERGLGCPDISILELLSKELGVSVLEILKGRKVENEVIRVTEADDYVKESLRVSKETTKNHIFSVFSKLIFIGVSVITIIFVILSISNYAKAAIGETVTIDNEYILKNKYELDRMKKNIEKLNNNQSILNKEELEYIKKDLEMLVDYSSSSFLLKLNDKKYSASDIIFLYIEDAMSPKYPSHIMVDFIEVLKNHNIYDEYKTRAMLGTMKNEMIYVNYLARYYQRKNQEYINISSYNALVPYILNEYTEDNQLSYACNMLLSSLTDRLEVFNLFIEEFIKDGDLNV